MTLTTSASLSQSSAMWTTSCVWPEVAPLCHSSSRARAAGLDGVAKVLQRAGAARGDHADLERRRHRAEQRDVIAGVGTVAIDGGQQNLAGAEGLGAFAPLHGIDAGAFLAAAHHDLA